jgi:hypothetical protein
MEQLVEYLITDHEFGREIGREEGKGKRRGNGE